MLAAGQRHIERWAAGGEFARLRRVMGVAPRDGDDAAPPPTQPPPTPTPGQAPAPPPAHDDDRAACAALHARGIIL
jgi:hypothetical protein